MRRSFVLFWVLALISAGWVVAPAASGSAAPAKAVLGADRGVSVSSHLLDAVRLSNDGLRGAELAAAIPTVTFDGGLMDVELRFDRLDEATVSAAESAGLEVTGAYLDMGFLDGRIAPAGIEKLIGLHGLATVHPMYGATTSTGSVADQADVSMRAAQARTMFGVDGSNVSVGVLSDSFDGGSTGTVTGSGCDRAVSGTSSQTAGDLPASVGLLSDVSGTDEGRGMAELIYDLAPGVDLTFRTAFVSEPDFAQGITDLVNCGSDIIVDDVIYFAEPMFQDGPVAQAAQAAVDAGVPYFSSAGNQATFGVDDMFDAGVDGFHDFGGTQYAPVTLDPGEGLRLFMQWNEPFDATLGDGAISDYDIYVLDAPNPAANVLSGSASAQGCGMGAGMQGGDPLEGFSYQNTTGLVQTVYVIVDQFCTAGGGGDHFRIAAYGLTTSITAVGFDPTIFNDAQQYGHAVAKDVASVAAVFYGEIDDPTVQPPNGQTNVEPFSSLGGRIPIYFDGQGDPLKNAPQIRRKPEISAADGTNTTFFGSDIGFDADAFPNFFGTSAAAPHAAAVAALLLDHTPGFTPAAIYEQLENTAIDIETAGRDDLSGHGLVDAVNALTGLPDFECNGKPATIVGTDGPDVIDGTPGKDIIVSRGGDDLVRGKGGNDVICLGSGSDVGIGGAGDDKIFGQAGKDTLSGNAGDDDLRGGTGVDTGDYSDANSAVDVDLAAGTGDEGADTLSSIENLEGSAFGDRLEGDGGKNVLDGNGGNDTLKGKGGGDTLKGGSGKDTLIGGSGGDTLKGAGGKDILIGGSGGDTIDGGSGSDTIEGGGGKDSITAGSGSDEANGGGKADSIDGGGGDDTLRGQSGSDTLEGKKGDDRLVGGKGDDILKGGPGTDSCSGEHESGCES